MVGVVTVEGCFDLIGSDYVVMKRLSFVRKKPNSSVQKENCEKIVINKYSS